MKYYRYIDLDYKIILDDVRSYIKNNPSKLKSSYTNLDLTDFLNSVPKFPSIFQPLNLTIKTVSVIISNDKFGSIHVDQADCKVRINIPILNCEKSETRFFINHGAVQRRVLQNGVAWFYVDPSKCDHVDTLVLDKPAVLRVTVPHQVVAGDVLPRISISVRFHENIDHLIND
jgi:hypothetical protein